MESKKNDTNELIHNTETESQTEKTNLSLPKQALGRDKLARDAVNKNQLDRTVKSTQYSVISYTRKEYMKKCINVCV